MIRGGMPMMTGGAGLGAASAASAMPGNPMVDPRSVPVDPNPYIYNSTVAKSQLEIINAQTPIATSNRVVFNIPANTQPGLMYDFTDSHIELPWSFLANPVAPYLAGPNCISGTDALWSDVSVQINGKTIDDQTGGDLYLFAAWIKDTLTLPKEVVTMQRLAYDGADPPPVAPVPATNDDKSYIDFPSEFLANLKSAPQTGILTNYRQIGARVKEYLRIVNGRALLADDTVYGVFKSKPRHPVFDSQFWLPADVTYRITLTKSVGSTVDPALFPSEFMVSTPINPPDPQDVWTISEPILYLRHITLTNSGTEFAYEQKARAMGILTYPCLRVELRTFQIPVNATGFNFNIPGQVKPHIVTLHMVSNENLSPQTLGPERNPISAFDQFSTGNSSQPSIQDLYVKCGTDTYPPNYHISRDNVGNKVSGGSMVRDYEIYKSACITSAQGVVLQGQEPRLSMAVLNDGGLSYYVLNLEEAQQAMLPNHKTPLTHQQNLEINATFNLPTANYNKTLIVGIVSLETFAIQGNRVNTSWG